MRINVKSGCSDGSGLELNDNTIGKGENVRENVQLSITSEGLLGQQKRN